MPTLFNVIVGLLAVAALGALFLRMDPRSLANAVRWSLPVLLSLGGAFFVWIGRVGAALVLFSLLLLAIRRLRMHGQGATRAPQRTTGVRTAALEMELDLDTGEMNGLVLAGRFEGQGLDTLTARELLQLYEDLRSDAESVQVLEAYLDARSPAWRDDLEADADERLGGAPSSGTMTEKEAYELLGLSPGASKMEIGKAHRRLLKRVHPDAGGSFLLAARINEAKEILLRRH